MTDHSIPQNDTPEKHDIIEEPLSFFANSETGTRLIDPVLGMCIEFYPDDPTVYLMKQGSDGRWEKVAALSYDDNPDNRRRLVALIAKALELE